MLCAFFCVEHSAMDCFSPFLFMSPCPWHPTTSSEPVLLLPNLMLHRFKPPPFLGFLVCNPPFSVLLCLELLLWSLKHRCLLICSNYLQFLNLNVTLEDIHADCLVFLHCKVRRMLILGPSKEHSLCCEFEEDFPPGPRCPGFLTPLTAFL